ncbi:AbrB family transcriptional regulator [Salipaludibacillus daqingensis]|uniref:AbrB family transcriptional regulator n=1 Tax=Salipaludibacillus daqingensis TaxID=3041001 RepID=UPI0024740DB3|nr:AbrB family transcriptional regulator [Salipaludibacillus daqingensis]
MKEVKPFIETLAFSILGGVIFFILNLPLPWMLGPLTSVMLWNGLTNRRLLWPSYLKNAGLIVLGMSFGLYFTMATIQAIGPYLIPYVILTFLLIIISIINSLFVSKFIRVDEITSVFGSIPGGLTEMVIASESLQANAAYVMVFQTIRLIVVLFTVPFIILYVFSSENGQTMELLVETSATFFSFNVLWLVIPIVLGVRFQNLLPAGIMIIPLAITAGLNIGPVTIPSIPNSLFLAAQLCVGTSLGKSISLKDVKFAGKFGLIYAGLAFLLIFISFGFGYILYSLTSMDLPTALLSTAPGGLVEMVLTASIVNADPAVVTSLQLTRIILIIVFVPVSLKWYFNRIYKT